MFHEMKCGFSRNKVAKNCETKQNFEDMFYKKGQYYPNTATQLKNLRLFESSPVMF